jgi:hypothetical protein
MRNFVFRLLAVWLLSAATAFAGSFTSNFGSANQTGYTLNTQTDTNGDVYPLVQNSELLLVYNEPNMSPVSIVLDPLDGVSLVDSFTASFQLQFGPGSSPPADGMAFAFGPDVGTYTVFGEEGPPMPDGGICVCFDTYNNGAPDHVGTDVKVMGDSSTTGGIVPGGSVTMLNTTMVDSQMHQVWIQVQRNGMFNMVWNGNVIYTNLFLTGWSPVSGQFAWGARNGGDSEQVLLNNIVVKTTLEPATPVAPTITSQPQSTTVNEGFSASFAVGFDGDAPFTFQWTENGVAITDATNCTLTLTQVSYTSNNAKFACTLTNPSGSLTSQAAVMTVIRDTTPPAVTNVVADATGTNVFISFSKPVSDTALAKGNYAISPGLTILSVTRVNQNTVFLATSPQANYTQYTVTINGVQDLAATPNTIAPNTQVQFWSFAYWVGAILHKVYFNCSPDGFTIQQLLADPRYPNNPDRVDLASGWEWPPNANGTNPNDPNKSMFYDSLEGYFIPPATGQYVFFTCGDDEWYLYLSTDENPANMYEVAEEPGGWSDNRAWITDHSGTIANWNTFSYAQTQWPQGNSLELTAGKKYYMIEFHHDHSWSGGDWFGNYYWGPTNLPSSDAYPAVGDVTTLTGNVIGFNFNPAGASLAFTAQPQSLTIGEGTTASFFASASGSSPYGNNVSYAWQGAPAGSTTWTNVTGYTGISGGNGSAFETLPVTTALNGTQVRAIAMMPPLAITSGVATLTVVAAPPVLSVGAMMDPTPGTIDVGVGFSEAVDDAAGSLMSNYAISSGTITSLTWCTNRFTSDSSNALVMVRKQSALLTVTGLSGASGTLTIKNMADAFGNKLSSTNVPFTVASNMSWGNVGANQLGGWQEVVPVAPNGFDIYSDGIAEWNNYDESTFAYEAVTGDFDKKLRVEYQDGSSEWARAGMVVREGTNVFGMSAATQEGSQGNGNSPTVPNDGLAGRYQKCHVNPVGPCLTGPGTLANALWEGNRRLDVGSGSTSALTNTDYTPQYPSAWCRIQRKGQTFSIFRSDDGITWELLGQTVWGQDDATKTPMPATVLVGPEFSPENGNITDTTDQGTFLAQFRDYGDYVEAVAFSPGLTIGHNAAGKIIITWSAGILVSSPTVNGTYTAVAGATSPYVVNPTGPAMFYRAMQQ